MKRLACLAGALVAVFVVSGTARADWASDCLNGSIDMRVQADGAPVVGGITGVGGNPVAPQSIRSLLGAQDGSEWYCPSQHTLVVGVAPGALDLATATQQIDAAIAADLGPDEAAWFTPHVVVESVPYSNAAEVAAANAIAAEIPSEPTPAAWGVRGVGPAGALAYPVVSLVLYDNRTDADVTAAQQLVAQYGGVVVLGLSDGPPLMATADDGPAPASLPAPVVTTAPTPSPSPSPPAPSTTTAPVATTTVPALSLTRVRYRRHAALAQLVVTAGAGPLHHVVVTALSSSRRTLGRRVISHISASMSLTVHLSAAPGHFTLKLQAGEAGGAPVTLVRRV